MSSVERAMIRAFIFDLDGTLVDTERLHYRSWKEVLLSNGIDSFTFKRFMDFVGTSNEKVAEDYIASNDLEKSIAELVMEKQKIYMHLISEVPLCEGVNEIIEAFFGKMKMAVASSSHRKEVCAILKIHQLSRYFNYVIGGDMVERRKPDPEIYAKTLSLLGVSATECLAFEDSTHGVVAAKDAGLYCVAIPNEFTRAHDFSRADRILTSLVDFNNSLLEEIVQSG